MSTKTKWLSVAIAGLALVASNQAFAGEGKVSTDGGFKIWHSDDGDKWFKFGGRIHLDQVFYMADAETKAGNFGNGGIVRRFRPKFSGGIGKNLSYGVEFSFNRGGSVDVYHAGLTYAPSDHWYATVGQLWPAYFGLENSRSSNATTFLEYNMQSWNWGPGNTFGIAWGYMNDGFSLNLVVAEPDGNSTRDSGSGGGADKIKYVGRVAYAPVYTDTTVYHVGSSFTYENLQHTGPGATNVNNVSLAGNVGGKSKLTGSLSDTGSFRARNMFVWEVDAGVTLCSWNVQAQYLQAKYGRELEPKKTDKDLTFKGAWIETSYILTGESLTYGADGGYFNGVTPESASGAWQVGARWDYMNFNDREITGGGHHNLSLGLNYYYNSHMRMMLTYNRALVKKSDPSVLTGAEIKDDVNNKTRTVAQDGDPKDLKLHTLGFRLQLTY